jgi:PAS domain S-box-containing protein
VLQVEENQLGETASSGFRKQLIFNWTLPPFASATVRDTLFALLPISRPIIVEEIIAVMATRKPYIRPSVSRYVSEKEYPDRIRNLLHSLPRESDNSAVSQWRVKPEYTTVVDCDRRFVQVSDSFCKLMGYQRGDLIGRQYDDLTAPGTNDIQTIFNMFSRLGYMHGLWMLESRNGAKILVRYESWLRPDSLIEGNMEVIGAGY